MIDELSDFSSKPTSPSEAVAHDLFVARATLAKAVCDHPWYDSVWLNQFIAAKAVIHRLRPSILEDFIAAFEPLRTNPRFQTQSLENVLTEGELGDIRQIIRELPATLLETHETERFGRTVVHGHPYFTELQRKLEVQVSDLAGEPVESSYNFLSLYSQLGVCEPHIDAPEAKWTLDLCIDQSRPWPIQFSQVVEWPEGVTMQTDDWKDRIRSDPSLRFTSQVLEPGGAILFSGSSQWHFRDALPAEGPDDFCNLLFLHFIPTGMSDLANARNWARIFDLPELDWVISPSAY